MPKIIPIKDLKDTNNIAEMCKESQEPIFVTKNGYGAMVIMSMETYERNLWLADARQKLAAADTEIKQGKVRDVRADLQGLKEKYAL